MVKPCNITELRDKVLESIVAMDADPRRVPLAKELNNSVGKVVATLRLQVDYACLRGEEPDVPFMGATSGRPLKPGVRGRK